MYLLDLRESNSFTFNALPVWAYQTSSGDLSLVNGPAGNRTPVL